MEIIKSPQPLVGKKNTRDGSREESIRVLAELERLCNAFGIGGRLPRHTELMRLLHTSERQIMRSLEDLQRQGRISRRHGSGTYVTDPSEFAAAQSSPYAPAAHIGEQTIVAIVRPDNSLFDRAMEILYEKAGNEDLDVACWLVGPDRIASVAPEKLGSPRGFIVFRHDLLPLAQELQRLGRRVVIVGSPLTGESFGVPSVSGHQELGGYLITKFLIGLGHTKIGYIDQSGGLITHSRGRGHLKALNEARSSGSGVSYVLIDHDELDRWRTNAESTAKFLRRQDAPTALACWNDVEGVEVLGLLSRAGIGVPTEVSVVGYDNMERGATVHPSLTTVDHFIDQQVASALELILAPTPPPSNERMIFAPTLVQRESTGRKNPAKS